MNLEEKYYNALIVSSSDKFLDVIKPVLKECNCDSTVSVPSVAHAERLLLESRYDFVIINSPLRDDTGIKLALDVSSGKNTVCLLLVKSDIYEEVKSEVTPGGVFTLAKPTSSSALSLAVGFMTAALERIKGLSKTTGSLEDKMKEIRLVNKAKWFLIDNKGLSEQQAHRYIEKTAMDRCVSKGEIAERILSGSMT